MKLAFYRMATTLGTPLIRLYLSRRLKRGKEDAARFNERLGIASVPRPDGPLVWLHAASVGEALSILSLIERLQSDHPDWTVLVTTGTVTSAKLMETRLPQGTIHQFVPVDCVAYVRRFLEHWKPDLALWVESEFWPNLVIETRASAVPMVVLNGRMSDSSYAQWKKSRFMIGRILAAFNGVLAQSGTDGTRFEDLGAKNVQVPGNLKFASPALPADDKDLSALQSQIGERPTWLAASTHSGEEVLCGQTHLALKDRFAGLLSVIAPRHPERGGEVCEELRALGLSVAQRSTGQSITSDTDVYVADTLGELGLFYRLSPIVFIGKTLKGVGGQNPIEPAQLSCALVFGPDMSNFADVSKRLLASDAAIQIDGADDLTPAIEALLLDEHKRTYMAQAGETFARSEAGVLDRIMEALKPYLSKDDKPDART